MIAPKSWSERCLSDALRGAGYRVEFALERDVALAALQVNAELALLVASESHFEPDDLCLALKRHRPTLPIVVLGPDVVPIKLRLFALGADDYVLDPVDRVELLARIKSLIRRHKLSSV